MALGIESMKILAIDPGLNTTGYGIIEISEREVSLLEQFSPEALADASPFKREGSTGYCVVL
ncbi:MAG: hypothetical protein COS88_05905 [Chloroflexi bacterium CG07_land_8_20_14_0_80_51_10]|nr:MAG: hypothetical protein COS88_05905 [Chloroflexi bacterium CG07_land_8_20_14_0_80_51_10]